MKSDRLVIAVIGAGPSSLYLLKNVLDHRDALLEWVGRLVVFERGDHVGMGMPYHPRTTNRFNLCNISSEELPRLDTTFADWMRTLDDKRLAAFDLTRGRISASETYERLLLGAYLESQYRSVVEKLREAGIAVDIRLNTRVVDIRDLPGRDAVAVVTQRGEETFDRVVIATGHAFNDPESPEHGFYGSPWPMRKLLPAAGGFHDFTVGTLGASLSAVDVVTSLAHRHGRFINVGNHLRFKPHPGTDAFRIVLHAADGWLPHLQYAQVQPFRVVYRHVSRKDLLALRDAKGFLRLGVYFDAVCRPALAIALQHDQLEGIAKKLRDKSFMLEAFVETMTGSHEYDDPFQGMKSEMAQAKRSIKQQKPIHWKEVLDDLFYTLNYHAEMMPAEDHARLRSVVMPFLMNVIAAMPLESARILLALRDAGRLDLVAGKAEVIERRDGRTHVKVGSPDGEGKTNAYRMFVDCTGEPPVGLKTYPFQGLVKQGAVRSARAAFADPSRAEALFEKHPERRLKEIDTPRCRLDGIDLDAAYRVIGDDGEPNPRLHDIAFPHATGLRPYSYGLQACHHAAGMVVQAWVLKAESGEEPKGDTETLTELQASVPPGGRPHLEKKQRETPRLNTTSRADTAGAAR